MNPHHFQTNLHLKLSVARVSRMLFGPYLGFSGRKDLWHLLKMVEDDEDAPSPVSASSTVFLVSASLVPKALEEVSCAPFRSILSNEYFLLLVNGTTTVLLGLTLSQSLRPQPPVVVQGARCRVC